jgi:hypothetical protein
MIRVIALLLFVGIFVSPVYAKDREQRLRETAKEAWRQATPEQRAAVKGAIAKQAAAMKAAMAAQMRAAMMAKQAEMKSAMEKQMKEAMTAKQAEMEKQMREAAEAKAKEAEAAAAGAMQMPSLLPSGLSEGKSEQGPNSPVKALPCLTKETLNGRPVVRNNCTGEWIPID